MITTFSDEKQKVPIDQIEAQNLLRYIHISILIIKTYRETHDAINYNI